MVWAAAALLAPAMVMAGRHLYTPKSNIGQWKQTIPEGVVKEIRAEVKRVKGSNKTFINARFGREGKTFENGRRVYLTSGDTEKVVWKVNAAPNGKDLIINAYEGEVFLSGVAVEY
jgi:hypothetical protein